MTHLSSAIKRPAFNPNAVDAAYAWLAGHKTKPTNVAAWGQFDESGKLGTAYDTYCNSPIGRCAYVAVRPTFKTIDATGERFFDWLLTRSYAAAYVMQPDATFGRDRGFVLSGRLPANFLVSISMASRQWTEHPQLVELMYELVDSHGVPEDAAFALVYSTFFVETPGTNSNHYPLQPADALYLRNFVQRQIVGTLARPLVESNSYRTVCQLWGTVSSGLTAFDDLAKIAEVGIVRDKVAIVNPFAKPARQRAYYETSTIRKKQLFDILPVVMEYLVDERPVARKAA